MSTLQRQLWRFVTVSALAIILSGAFNRAFVSSSISETRTSCQSHTHKKSCSSHTYTSCNKAYKLKKRSCSSSYSYSSSRHAVYPDINDFVAVDKLPTPTNFTSVSASIEYPAYAREKGIEGKVIARILVDKNGEYVKHKILKYDNCGMRHRVEQKLSHLHFSPAEKDGKQVAVWVNLPFSFKLVD